MPFDAETLYNLLPATYRVRDDAEGGPLRALVEIIAQEALALEEDLAQLYDDLFIETCAPSVAPYIGDLIGYRALHGVVPSVASPRAEIANTIAYRRRKGTAAMLEQLARDVTGHPARVVEFFQLLATTQYMNHIRREHRVTPDLRRWEPLERLGSPFDPVPRTADVRRIASGRGKYNIPNIGIFLWRVLANPLTRSPAFRLDERRFLFSPLGNNTPLFTRPQSEAAITQLAGPLNAPLPISRRVLHERLDEYYEHDLSLAVFRDGAFVPPNEIVVCNLSDDGAGWAHQPADRVAIDPKLGRIAFPTDVDPPAEVLVTFHYGFAAEIGGGEYERAATFDEALQPVEVVAMAGTVQAAIDALGCTGAVEIGDSGRYEETLNIAVGAGRMEIRAANERRPTLVLGGDWTISGAAETELTLNGLLITGGPLRVSGDIRTLRLRHCTLVPGLALGVDGTPRSPDAPSLIVESTSVTVEIESCILGGIRAADGAEVRISNSIVDATAEDRVAYAGLDGDVPGGPLQLENCTLIGRVRALGLELASNTIFLARGVSEGSWIEPMRVERRQAGCVRFSFVPPGSRTPRRHRCQPADEAQAARVRPQLASPRYGDPTYAMLSARTASEVREGADDGSEMGAFHNQYEPQREANLRARLEEYLRFGLEAGVFYT